MQPHQLAYFLAVAETGSFTQGAQRAGVVQSAASAAIAQLERELGARLFARGYHRLDLTAEGAALLPHARDVLAAIQSAKDAVAGAHGQLVGTVRLGTLALTGPWDLAAVLQRFAVAHPRVEVHLRQTISGSVTSLEEVRSGSLDLALVSVSATDLPGLALTEIHREPMVLACSPDHRLADAVEVSITELAAEPFIEYPTGWGNRATVDQAFASARLTRTIRTEVTDFALARTLVARNLGVTILPVSAIDATITAVRLHEHLEWAFQLAQPNHLRISRAASELARAIIGDAS
jgi:DNA-binding transcriptional LysR family regulator